MVNKILFDYMSIIYLLKSIHKSKLLYYLEIVLFYLESYLIIFIGEVINKANKA